MKPRKIVAGHSLKEWCLNNSKTFLLDEWDTEKNAPLTSDNISYASNVVVWWKCPRGHSYQSKVSNRVLLSRNCPFCSGRKVLLGFSDFETWCIRNERTDLLAEWDSDKNVGISPKTVSYGSGKRVWWKCSKNHSWDATLSSRTTGRKIGCPYCSNPPKRILVGFNDFKSWCTLHERQDLLEEWDAEKNHNLSPESMTYGSGKKVWWKCNKGHSWRATIASRTQGTSCPVCARTQTSFPEQAIAFYLSKVFRIVQRYRLCGYEIDIYIPNYKLGIEYDGMYFHDENSLRKEDKKDAFYQNRGIKLIHVKESLTKSSIEGDRIYFVVGKRNYLDKNFNTLLKSLLSFVRDATSVYGEDSIDVIRDWGAIKSHYGSALKDCSLAILYPALSVEWNTSKNGELTPDHFSAHSHDKVWWKCKNGHEWQASIASRTRGLGCPYCAGQRTIVGKNDLESWCQENAPQLLGEWDYERNGFGPNEISRLSNRKVWWKCKNGHEWQAIIPNRVHGTGCPFCPKQPVKRMTLSSWCRVHSNSELLKEWDYEKNGQLTPDNVSFGSHRKVWWKCAHGHSWQAVVKSRTHNHGCPYCSPTNKKVVVGKNDLATWCKLNGKEYILNEWDYEANKGMKPEMFSFGSHERVHWRCSNGHKWTAVIKERTKSKGNTCPKCKKPLSE